MTSAEHPVFPTPVRRTPESASFFDGARGGVLVLQRCRECGTVRGPQGRACPTCHAVGADPSAAAGTGRIVSWSTVHRSPLPGVEGPYVVAMVELVEGPWLLVRLLDVTDAELLPVPLAIGRRVDLVSVLSGPDTAQPGEALFAARLTGA